MALQQVPTDTSQAGSPVGGRGRLSGVDAARGIALLGMMSVHIVPAVDETGRTSTAFLVASGRASALFAVLAGVGLALTTGGPHPHRDRRLLATRSGLIARASLLALLGLTLGAVDTPVAIILVYYALMFVCALPFLSLGARALAPLAVGWALLAPALSHMVRSSLYESGGGNVTAGPAVLRSTSRFPRPRATMASPSTDRPSYGLAATTRPVRTAPANGSRPRSAGNCPRHAHR
jgi:uncharacterized membrane protein YeiB